MGTYLNPENSGFAEILQSDYVDKTGMISLINSTIGTKKKLTCVSRPRRFGKSYAAQMLSAYYVKTCDSHELFAKYEIAQDESYEKHLNKYHVISLDISGFISTAVQMKKSLSDIPATINTYLLDELKAVSSEMADVTNLSDGLLKLVRSTGAKIVFIIDEWDSLIREAADDPDTQEAYLNLLRGWFKNNNFTPEAVAAAYMTGILPIKKQKGQSAVSDFEEYTVIKPGIYGKYVGFTEEEVKKLCDQHNISFEPMKQWYDGYEFKDTGAIYNPNSVIKAISHRDFDSYWPESSAAEGLMEYISKPYNGLVKTIAELIGGVDVKVDTKGFANDLVTFRGQDDVLTLMIHLGYLAYDSEAGTVHIPNEEIKLEFQKAIKYVHHEATVRRLQESEQLFLDTINMNEEAVAAQIEKIHREETSPLHYNKEDSLRSVIKLAYYTYRDNYLQWEELPAGEGYADIVYLPKRDSDWPVLVIELKWNKSAKGAIDQIMSKHYPDILKDYGSEILLVGINYDKDARSGEKKHECRIIKI
ncbi:MAG: AAA family ATPase [Lachnospiraceae bacterium]|nr:AAA family ATPase [Lachnospiraceae bacterium]